MDSIVYSGYTVTVSNSTSLPVLEEIRQYITQHPSQCNLLYRASNYYLESASTNNPGYDLSIVSELYVDVDDYTSMLIIYEKDGVYDELSFRTN